MQLPSKYDAPAIESKWYTYWEKNGYFNSEPDHRKAYTICIPPPNVTGVLHMGHMLNNTIQDVLIRKARLQGFNACWVPGTDHASIATEAKVVQKLQQQGIDKKEIGRAAFLEHAWDWTHKHGGIILEQLKKLGASCDWNRTKFTLDDDMYESVIKVFVDLYQKGLVYRGYRMVNWDPQAQTTLSDEEVIHKETEGALYHIKYPLKDSNESLIIATTRPETLLGDTAICVHPDDERYKHLHGKYAVVPVANRTIPIILDEYVDREFGTGCLKVTPAHDFNDRNLGEKHQLEFINIFNEDASLNENGLHYQGMDRFEVRKKIVQELQDLNVLVKTEKHLHKVGYSERTDAVVEPRLSDQWFLDMKTLAEPALKAVLEKEIQIFPEKFINTYRHWMENVQDWNISRQLWWGHRIPAYFYGTGKDDFVVAESREEALKLAREKTSNYDLKDADLRQDEDVLDTWFSSWLWPISVFDGIRHPDNSEINYYYPTQDLVTAPEILFFWVARMVMAGYEYRNEKPFENVYLTGIVRDSQRRKMSKSLGNSPDPIELIQKYGADGVRVGMLLSSPAGNDLMFDEDLCQQGKNFVNKIWNALRLIDGWEVAEVEQPEYAQLGLEWFENNLQKSLLEIENHFSKYRISDALMTTYKLVWDDFCSWLLEILKPEYGKPIDAKTHQSLIQLFENLLVLLHPFTPFITEEVWQHLKDRSADEALIVAHWPNKKAVSESLAETFEEVKELISEVRRFRKEKNVSHKIPLELKLTELNAQLEAFNAVLIKMAGLASAPQVDKLDGSGYAFRVRTAEYFIPIASDSINVEEELEKMTKELQHAEGFLKSVRAKLTNDRFVSSAPKEVVEKERQKETDALKKIEILKRSIAALN